MSGPTHLRAIAHLGASTFESSFSNNPASTTGTGNAMASFLLGYPASTEATGSCLERRMSSGTNTALWRR